MDEEVGLPGKETSRDRIKNESGDYRIGAATSKIGSWLLYMMNVRTV